MKRLTIMCDGTDNPVVAVTALLGVEGINISDIDFSAFGDRSVLSITVTDYDKALGLLVREGYQAVSEDVVLIHGEDRPGNLAELSQRLDQAGIGIRSMTLAASGAAGAVVAIATDDNAKARELFADKLVN